ncbi:hypothetical protein AB0L30_32610 [Microbispora rosea]|uniref:hypothetical protein n=1 Tax=Microbispora rosea TaxID=58117 RepID=UPI0034397AA9
MSTATEQDVIDLLPAQHNQIKTTFTEVAAARGERKRAPPRRRRVRDREPEVRPAGGRVRQDP